MNKFAGFYELKDSNLPAVDWKEFKSGTKLDPQILWTIRSSLYHGADQSLPRLIGAKAKDAEAFAEDVCKKFKNKGMVVYYPYFIADKSGTVMVTNERVIIEACKDDLWNLVDKHIKEVTLRYGSDYYEAIGDADFLTFTEKQELRKYADVARRMFRNELAGGDAALLEWSYAFKSDVSKQPVGDRSLVFYEARTI